MTAQRHRIVIEGDDMTNYSAYSPDLPGVVATGATREACEREMQEAIEFHLEGLEQDEPSGKADAAEPLLAFENVDKRYDKAGQEIIVLDDVSFEIATGATVAVMGARRAGKSTLLRLAAGFEMPSRGAVRFEGHDMTAMSPRKRERLLRGRIALISSQAWPAGNTTVIDFAAMPFTVEGISLAEASIRARRLLDRMEIADLADERMRGISLADRPRVLLAQAVAREPTLLLVDEPATIPSGSEGERFVALLRAVAAEHKITLVIASEEMAMLDGVEMLMSIGGGQLRSIERRAAIIDFPKRRAAQKGPSKR